MQTSTHLRISLVKHSVRSLARTSSYAMEHQQLCNFRLAMPSVHSFLRLLLALGALGLLTAPGGESQEILTRYPVNWTFVPVTQQALSCSGSGDSATAKNLTLNCICNLQPFQCDVGCCCDTSCPAGLTRLYQSSGTCLPEGPPPDSLMYCVAAGIMEKVRPEVCQHAFVTALRFACCVADTRLPAVPGQARTRQLACMHAKGYGLAL